MSHNTIIFQIRGISPLIMHNGKMADPLYPFVKQMRPILDKKNKRTDDDFIELARLEWTGSLYHNFEGKLILPELVWEAAINSGAKFVRLGKAFKAAVSVGTDSLLDIGETYDHAHDLWGNERYRDTRGARVGQSRVQRTRPIFDQWSCQLNVVFDSEQVNESAVIKAVIDCGIKCGVGDFRPRFGRFEVVTQ